MSTEFEVLVFRTHKDFCDFVDASHAKLVKGIITRPITKNILLIMREGNVSVDSWRIFKGAGISKICGECWGSHWCETESLYLDLMLELRKKGAPYLEIVNGMDYQVVHADVELYK